MNPRIDSLQPYPFERLNALKNGLSPATSAHHIALSIGEPKHEPPAFVVEAFGDPALLTAGLGGYPATRGSESLRAAIAAWVTWRFELTRGTLGEAHVLPVNGTREALFSFGQAMLSGTPRSVTVMPNPFYQIYEGAAVLGGAEPYFVACPAETGFVPAFERVPDAIWRRCELLYLCTPGNPTGTVLDTATLRHLIALADRFDFVIAADECYSEIYFDEAAPPPGLLSACAALGRDDFARCMVFHSLSKRSNLPGLRSGFVAGDRALIERFYQFRTYHGCAMPGHVQRVSEAVWADEAHVKANRDRYREKFEAVTPLLARALPVQVPEAGFYYWPETPGDDQDFARRLFTDCNVTVLPGSYLGRVHDGTNPGNGRVRMALVAPLAECIEAAERIATFVAHRA